MLGFILVWSTEYQFSRGVLEFLLLLIPLYFFFEGGLGSGISYILFVMDTCTLSQLPKYVDITATMKGRNRVFYAS